MLFRYNDKIYIKPFGDKLVEVRIVKKGNEFDVKPTDKIVVITPKVNENLYSVELKEAYNMQNKTTFKGE